MQSRVVVKSGTFTLGVFDGTLVRLSATDVAQIIPTEQLLERLTGLRWHIDLKGAAHREDEAAGALASQEKVRADAANYPRYQVGERVYCGGSLVEIRSAFTARGGVPGYVIQYAHGTLEIAGPQDLSREEDAGGQMCSGLSKVT